MPEYLAPGVYVEEINVGPVPIEGVGTSTAGFVGQTERGPTSPRLITSWLQFQRWYGTHIGTGSYLSYAVQGFFQNGGQRVFVARVVNAATGTAALTMKDANGEDALIVQAIGKGAWGNNILVRIKKGSQADLSARPPRDLFRLTILYYRDGIPDPFIDPTDPKQLANKLRKNPDALEDYDNLSVVEGSANYVLSVVNPASQLIELSKPKADVAVKRPVDVDFQGHPQLMILAGDPALPPAQRPKLVVQGGTPGQWAAPLRVTVTPAQDGKTFTLAVTGRDAQGNQVTKTYAGLVPASTDDNSVEKRVNADVGPIVRFRWGTTEGEKFLPVSAPNVPQGDFPLTKGTKNQAAAAQVEGLSGATLQVEAAQPGDWANSLKMSLSPQATPEMFDLTIQGKDAAGNDFSKTYTGLSLSPSAPNYFMTRVNEDTEPLLRVSWQGDPAMPVAVADQPLAAGPTSGLSGGGGADGQDAKATIMDYAGNELLPVNDRTGLAGLAAIDEIALLAVPDEVNTNITNSAEITNMVLDQCETLKDRFAVLSIAGGQGLITATAPMPPRDTSYGAVYYPWINVFDPLTQDYLLVPPAGHVVGVYARTDVERGVHKAPANEVVRGILTRDIGNKGPLEFKLSKREQDILNPRGVNVIRDFRSDRRDIRVWGARTMSTDGQWKYVNVRRLFIFVEESIDEGTQWVVFEPNDENTWSRVRRSVSNFLTRVWRDGALMGTTPAEAFFVKCDRTTMTQDDIDNGRLICYIGIAPVKPAEFVIFRISQYTAEAQA